MFIQYFVILCAKLHKKTQLAHTFYEIITIFAAEKTKYLFNINKKRENYEKYEDCGHRSLRRHGDGRM